MEIQLPVSVLHILQTLQSAGFSGEIVGGAVRDLLLDKSTSDWDFATDATPEQIQPLFTDSFYENSYGTVMVAQKHLAQQFGFPCPEEEEDLVFDITTYRSDGEYRNHRKPETVSWGQTIEEDLKRRDFTINAIAIRVKSPEVRSQLETQMQNSSTSLLPLASDHYTFIDPYLGQEDLKKRVIKTVGDPHERFQEDALRMLRAVRFASTLGFVIDKETGDAIHTHAKLLEHISQERISSEFLKMIASDRPAAALSLLDQLGLLPYILPELVNAKGVRQSGHHIYDVYEHSVRALDACVSKDSVVRLATLLHDIAKPVTAKETANGTVTFYNHEVIGARMAKQIAQRFRLPKQDCDRIFTLVRWHMFTYESFVTDAYIRRFIRRVGLENLEDIFALRIGDRVGSGSKATSWRLEELKDRVWQELHQPMKLTDMVVDGNDVMKELGVKPGPEIGKILNALFEEVLENPENNTREYLLPKMRDITLEEKTYTE